MARAATKKKAKPSTKPAKPGRPAVAAKTKKTASVKKSPSVKAPAVSKDELRAQLEKSQTTIATLRTKAREATRAAKSSAAQIAELEATLAKLEKKSVTQQKSPVKGLAAVEPAKRRGRKAAEKAEAELPNESGDQDLTEREALAVD